MTAGGFARSPASVVAVVLNLVLPAAALLTTVWYPRRSVAALAGPMTYGGYLLGLLLSQDPKFWQWPLASLFAITHPVFVVGSLVLSVLAVTVAWSASAWRRVGRPPDRRACKTCGYHREDLAVCPECGTRGL